MGLWVDQDSFGVGGGMTVLRMTINVLRVFKIPSISLWFGDVGLLFFLLYITGRSPRHSTVVCVLTCGYTVV